MPRRSAPLAALILGTFSAALSSLAGACGGGDGSTASNSTGSGHGGSAATSTGSHSGGAGGGLYTTGTGTGGGLVDTNYPCSGCPAFPADGAPACDPAALGAPKIAYPLDGILLPPNMNVLEVQFVPPAGATLFEVDFTNGVTHVKVETQCTPVPDVRGGMSKGCGITLPQGAWNDIANTNRDGDPVKVTVRATKDGSCVASSTDQVKILFAKDDLAGGIYYWQSAVYGGVGGKTGGIFSHDFGTLDPTPTPFYTSGATGTCVGCHSLSRDGVRIALATDDPDADDEFGDVKSSVLDVASRAVVGGKNVSPGFQTFTHDHARMIASTFKDSKNAAFDVFDGDGLTLLAKLTLPVNMKATQPDLSKDDHSLVFVVPASGTISSAGDHHFMGGSLYTATFDPAANTLGAPAAILTASATENYYYPSIAPSQSFVVFNDAVSDDSFYNRKARVKLLHFPAKPGDKPLDLPALNVADGLTNSWPRWSPFVQTYKGKKLLWVTFSSNRDYGLHLVNKGFDNCYPPESPAYDQPQPLTKQGVGYESCAEPQIWMAGIVVEEDGSLDATDRSFPAFWLPFQDVNSHNHSAQWVEAIPGMPGPDGGTDGGSCGMLNAPCDESALCCDSVICCGGVCSDISTCVK